MVSRNDHEITTQRPRSRHRHRRANPVSADLIGGGGDDATRPRTADNDRATDKGRIPQPFDGDEERVHVDMADPLIPHPADATGLFSGAVAQR